MDARRRARVRAVEGFGTSTCFGRKETTGVRLAPGRRDDVHRPGHGSRTLSTITGPSRPFQRRAAEGGEAFDVGLEFGHREAEFVGHEAGEVFVGEAEADEEAD